MLIFLVYIVSGLIMSYLITLNFIKIQEKKEYPAAILEFIIVLFSLLILDNILGEPNNIVNIVSYALGNAIGCFIAVLKSKRKE